MAWQLSHAAVLRASLRSNQFGISPWNVCVWPDIQSPFSNPEAVHRCGIPPYPQDRSQLVQLLIRFLSVVVLVLVVWSEVEVFAERKRATREDGDSAPFLILACVPELSADVGRYRVTKNLERPLHCDAVPTVPGEIAVLPVKIGAVFVGEQLPTLRPDVGGDIRFTSVC